MRPSAEVSRGSRLARAAMLLLAQISLNVALAPPAAAAKVRFGTQEYLQKLQDVDVKGPNGEALYLGYKYSHHSFVAPYYTTDDGYILGVVGQQSYYPLDAALVERLQAQKLLPSPLPPYSLSALDYLIGHLLWFIVAGVVISILFAWRKQGQQKQAVPFAAAGLARLQRHAARSTALSPTIPRSSTPTRRTR